MIDRNSTTETKKKSGGGSALKRLKQTLSKSGIYTQLNKVSKNSNQKKIQKSIENRSNAKQFLKNLSKSNQSNNPFEFKHTNVKHTVIGRKVKGTIGKPGQVRAQHQKIRQNTLSLESKNKKNENIMMDRRIGEHDPTLSIEDKMLERFMKEKTKNIRANAMYNLEEEDELTHLGQSLSGFDDAGLEAVPNDDESDGMIDASVVKYTHFGGFDEGNDPNAKKSRNEIMKEVIAKSKMYKRERQQQKEFDQEMTEKLDEDLDEIRGLLAPMGTPKPVTEGKMVVSADRLKLISGEITRPTETQEKVDLDYDKYIREMVYDRRAKPTDRIKSEEELALEAKLELEQLEEARIKRMNGIVDEDTGRKRSKLSDRPSQADDLGTEIYSTYVGNDTDEVEEKVMPLTYKDGVLVNNEIFMKPKTEDSEDEEDGEESQDDEDSEDDSEESEDESDGELEQNGYVVEEIENESEHSNSQQDHSESDDGDETLEPSFEDDDQKALEEMYDSKSEDESEQESKQTSTKLKRKLTDDMKIAQNEIPYTFTAPETYQDLLEIIQNHSTDNQAIILQRIRILFNPKLSAENKTKMNTIFTLLLQHWIELGNQSSLDMETIKLYGRHVDELAHIFPSVFAIWCRNKVVELRDSLNKGIMSSKKQSGNFIFIFISLVFPNPVELLLFKMLSSIFSTSDLHHTVITPVMLLLGQILSQAPLRSFQDVVSGLFICNVLYDYIRLSKRQVPELINYLYFIIIHTLKSVYPKLLSRVLPTLRTCTVELDIQDFTVECQPLNFNQIFGNSKIIGNDNLRLTILVESIILMIKLCKLYNDSTTIIEIFTPMMDILDSIPVQCTPSLKNQISSARRIINPLLSSATLKRKPLQLQKRKAIPIKTFAPKFHTTYSLDKKYDGDRARAEDSKAKAEYRKEFKGAIRELRKDAAYLGREKLERTKEKDRQYKKKMDKIKGSLAEQEGAMRGYEKLAKKDKKKR
ncbi:nucleolar protein 14 [Globomyces pollinis-pini]|nr:nucleolar protein 14 [Globomyces pollinis-pini]